jgi:NAD(P)-dependent dehydrogenase (short-subunit alcohol dehydrogenase family)
VGVEETAADQQAGYELTGQKVLVVGGGGRMGLAVARRAVSGGAEVIISGRAKDRLEAASAAVEGEVGVFAADSSVTGEAERLMRAAAPLDHVVVTASGDAPAGDSEHATRACQGAFSRFWLSYNVLHLAPRYVRPTGSVALLSGSSGRRPAAGYGVWGTLHGAIEALAKNAALELAPIRVNVVSPGGIGMRPDRQLARHAGVPEDVAAMVLAVMTNPAVTGAVVDVDGGERLGDWSGR